MKIRFNIFFIFLIVLLVSCAQKKIIVSEKHPRVEMVQPVIQPDPGDGIFFQAVKKHDEKSYSSALEDFNRYLSGFPAGPRIPEVLLRIGSIHAAMDKPRLAIPFYERLISRYPGSPLVHEAQAGLLKALFNAGDFKKAIELGQILEKKNLPEGHRRTTSEIMADAYLNLGKHVEAVYYYSNLLEKSTGNDKTRLSRKFGETISLLSASELFSLLKRLGASDSKAEILLQIAKISIESGNDEEAYAALAALSEQFPGHATSALASQLLNSLKKRSDSRRHAVGCLLPLSGLYESYGKKALKGIELAHNRFTLHNPDTPVNLIIKDTESNNEKTVFAVKELAEERVDSIIGPIATADIAAIEAQKYGIPIITLTQKDQITNTGSWVFRHFITPLAQVSAVSSYAVKKLGLSRFAILYPDEPYGINFMNLFRDQIVSEGATVVRIESYDPAATDFRETLKRLSSRYSPVPENRKSPKISKRKGMDGSASGKDEIHLPLDFEALFIPDTPHKLSVIAPQLIYGNLRPAYLIGTNLWNLPRLISNSGQSVQGAIIPEGFFPESASEKVQVFVRAFHEAFNESPGYVEAVSYDTALMMFNVLKNTKNNSRSSIREELLKTTVFPGVTGSFHFNHNREAEKKLFILQFRGKRFVEVARPEL